MSRLGKWISSQAPSRESFERSRFLRPFAQRVFHPALWRFTRRSVPRGAALGLLVGIFFLIPGVQIAGAALLALPVRATQVLEILYGRVNSASEAELEDFVKAARATTEPARGAST